MMTLSSCAYDTRASYYAGSALAFSQLWRFHEHLFQHSCLGNWKLYATCNECMENFGTWFSFTNHYENFSPKHAMLPSWCIGRLQPSTNDEPLHPVQQPYYITHLTPVGTFWTYKTGSRIEYVYRPYLHNDVFSVLYP